MDDRLRKIKTLNIQLVSMYVTLICKAISSQYDEFLIDIDYKVYDCYINSV